MPQSDTPTKDEATRHILRNQRLIMLALANIASNVGGVMSGYVNKNLHDRVRQMENQWDWMCPPSQRL